jgi:hypothetical protein
MDFFSRGLPKTFGDAMEDLRLRQVLQKAVNREAAPQYLIDRVRESPGR